MPASRLLTVTFLMVVLSSPASAQEPPPVDLPGPPPEQLTVVEPAAPPQPEAQPLPPAQSSIFGHAPINGAQPAFMSAGVLGSDEQPSYMVTYKVEPSDGMPPYIRQLNDPASVVPEPSSKLMLGAGAIALIPKLRKRSR